jgi:spore coat protein U-like protein
MRELLGVVIGLALLACAASAEASCSISVGSLAFGTYNVFNTTPTYTTGSVSYRCTRQESVWITLSRGTHSSTFRPRRMASPSDLLGYYLFIGTGYTSVWGDGYSESTSAYFASRVPAQWVAVTIYGRIDAGQDVAVGAYTDTVTVTVNF